MSSTILLRSVEIQIPGYRVLRPIGEGGMASVYLAVQESLDREVALKVMAPALSANSEFAERFLKEGQITAKLSHPNLVTVFDIGSHGGTYYLAAEYIPGGTLREQVQAGMSIAAALDVAIDVARGLHFAHGKGFVHRDVKPGNILFKNDGTAVLADFGIAKAMDAKSGATMAGASIGTPDYMSPEQARAEKVDGRSDLYSLGAVLFEMLTGRPPYEASDPFTVALMHVTQPVPDLPRDLAWLQPLIDGLMAKNVEARVASGEEFIHQVEQLLAAAPQAASIQQGREGTRKRGGARLSHTPTQRGRAVAGSARRTRVALIGAGVTAVLLVAAAGWWWTGRDDGGAVDGLAAPQPSVPVQPGEGTPIGPVPLQPVAGDASSPTSSASDPEDDVGMLLTQADSYLESGIVPANAGRRLVFPEDESAAGLYQRVLGADPGNARAQAGLAQIRDFYLRAAQALCTEERQLWSSCLLQVQNGLVAVPDDAELLAFKALAERRMRGD